jgi:hypothetical protein
MSGDYQLEIRLNRFCAEVDRRLICALVSLSELWEDIEDGHRELLQLICGMSMGGKLRLAKVRLTSIIGAKAVTISGLRRGMLCTLLIED